MAFHPRESLHTSTEPRGGLFKHRTCWPTLTDDAYTGDGSLHRRSRQEPLQRVGDVSPFHPDERAIWVPRLLSKHARQCRDIVSHESGENAMPLYGRRGALAAGLILFSAAVLAFSTLAAVGDPAWGTATLVEHDDLGHAYDPVVAMDDNGGGVAVWRQTGGSMYHIWSAIYQPGSGWQAPQQRENRSTGSAGTPAVALSGVGAAIVAWTQYDGAHVSVFADSYRPSGGWAGAVGIENLSSGDSEDPKVTILPDGSAIVAWSQFNGSTWVVYSNVYSATGGWQGESRVSNLATGGACCAAIASDSTGKAFLVWSTFNGSIANVVAAIWTPTNGWGPVSLLDFDDSGDATNPDVATDDYGDAVAVWQQSNGSRSNIWSASFSPAGGWRSPELLETNDSGAAWYPRVSMNSNGKAVATWYQYDGFRYNIWANSYAGAVGWGSAVLIEADNRGDASSPIPWIDDNGVANVVWQQSDGSERSILANRQPDGGSWGYPILLETDDTGNALPPSFAGNPRGDGIAVWSQFDGVRYNVWANVLAMDTEPPSLSIAEPREGDVFYVPSARVSGSTESGALLTINGITVAVRSNGTFSLVIGLVDGVNQIEAIAEDVFGNVRVVSVNVTFSDPIPGIISSISNITGDIADVQAELSTLDARVSEGENRLGNLEATGILTAGNLSGIWDDVNTTDTQLNEARIRMNGLAQQVQDLAAQLQSLQSTLDANRNLSAEDAANLSRLRDETIPALTSNLTDLENELSTIEQRQAGLDSRVTKLESAEGAAIPTSEMSVVVGLFLGVLMVAMIVFNIFLVVHLRGQMARLGSGDSPLRDASGLEMQGEQRFP